MPHPAEVLDAVVAPDVPSYVIGLAYHNLGYGCSPASASDYCYFAAIEHFVGIVIFIFPAVSYPPDDAGVMFWRICHVSRRQLYECHAFAASIHFWKSSTFGFS